MSHLNPGDTVRVVGFHGVACRVIGPETHPGPTEWYDEDSQEWVTDEEPERVETGRILVVMVGDDHRYAVDPEDCTPLDEDGYCRECGQIGCYHGREVTRG